MRKKNKVLVTLDESNQTFDTARYAGRMLAGCGARIVLYHVRLSVDEAFWDIGINSVGRRQMAGIRAWEKEQHRTTDELLERAIKIMVRTGVARDRISVKIAPRNVGVARDIIRESSGGYDAVVVGRKGQHGLRGLVLGSVPNKLIEKVRHIPLWVVGGNPSPAKLLIGLDASEGAMRAVDHVVSTRNGQDDRIVYLVHVVRAWQTVPSPVLARADRERVKNLINKAEKTIQPVFKTAISRLKTAGYSANQIHTEVISEAESRAMALVHFARQEKIGSLVLGRRGLSRVEDFIIGRVGHRIVNTVRNRAVWLVA